MKAARFEEKLADPFRVGLFLHFSCNTLRMDI